MQQFITRSTFDDDVVLQECQKMLGKATSSKNGMLSTDGSEFIKKGKNSAGVSRQYCGRYGKTENCQAGVFCAYAGENGYGLVFHPAKNAKSLRCFSAWRRRFLVNVAAGYASFRLLATRKNPSQIFSRFSPDETLVDKELYLPKDWFDEEHKESREKCGIPEDKVFQTKNEIALGLLKKAVESGDFNVKWIGCDAAFGCDHDFLDSLPGDVWYFAGTNAKERVFLSRPEMKLPDQPKTGGRYKHEVPSFAPVQVKEIAADDTIPWQRVLLFEGSKGSVYADFKCIRCISCRTATKFGNYIHPHTDVWLYIRRYENNDVKYFLSNAPENIELPELHEAATLRWPIEQCFEECKNLFP